MGLGMLGGPLAAFAVQGCGETPDRSRERIQSELDSLAASSGAEVGLYYRDLGGDDSLVVSPDLRMHAASTMKVPVMMRLFLDRDEGILSLDDSVEVTTTFHSIVDGSPFPLPRESDSETTLYDRVGRPVSYRDLVEAMITVSSNLATNLLIRDVDAQRVTALVRALGADSMEVLRGVEDLPAFQAGLSNTTTARDLGVILTALGRGEVGSPETSREMVDVLLRQKLNTMIPAGVPQGAAVAHKTGWITGITHDAGIVYPPDSPPFVLVILTRGFLDEPAAEAFGVQVTRLLYAYHVRKHLSASS